MKVFSKRSSLAILLITGTTVLPFSVGQSISPCHSILATYPLSNGQSALSNGADQGSGNSCAGSNFYQCVEYVKRFYVNMLWFSQAANWHGNAVTYYATAAAKGLVAYPNGGSVSPQPNDILVFQGGQYGHVAIVTAVTPSQLSLIEENWSPSGTFSLQITSGRVANRGRYSVLGWLRLPPTGSSVLLGTSLPSGPGDLTIAQYQFAAQQFSITASIFVGGINLDLAGFGVDQFTLWLTNAIGPSATTSNVLLQKTSTFPNSGGGLVGAQTVSVPVGLSLAPGNYYIVLSSAQTSIYQGWAESGQILTSSVGSVGVGSASCCLSGSVTNGIFPPASTFISSPFTSGLAFQLIP